MPRVLTMSDPRLASSDSSIPSDPMEDDISWSHPLLVGCKASTKWRDGKYRMFFNL